jgi:hypothetical protein
MPFIYFIFCRVNVQSQQARRQGVATTTSVMRFVDASFFCRILAIFPTPTLPLLLRLAKHSYEKKPCLTIEE